MPFKHNAKIVNTTVLASVGKKFELLQITVWRQLFSGETQPLLFKPVIFERGDAAAALLYDMDTGVVILTYQFRAPTLLRPVISNGWIYEIMAGMIEPGEDGKATIKREAIEELGYRVLATNHISDFFVSPGASTEVIYLYAAQVTDRDVVNDGGGVVAEGEDIRRVKIRFDEAFRMLDSGEIKDAKTIITLMWLRRKLNM